MRITHLVTAGAVTAGGLLLAGGAAGADVVTPPGACVAVATFTTGLEDTGSFSVDTQTLQPGDVITVPLEDVVAYTAQLSGVAEGERQISGKVVVKLPWPLPDVTVGDWSGTATQTEATGQKSYDLPSATPRGVELEIRGVHNENGAEFCSGVVKAKVEGGALDSPITYVSIAGTALAGVGLVAAGRPKWKRMA